MAVRKKADFEKQMARLQEIVTALEASHNGSAGATASLSLEKSVALYKEGVQLARDSRAQLDAARHEVRLVTEEGLKSFAEDTNDSDAI
ncbi:MAG: exodeoxyribonuclease VII small subunit [Pseudomonadota bacterium]